MEGRYATIQEQPARSIQVPPTTITHRLYQRKAELEKQLEMVEEAIASIEASPEVERAVNALARVGSI